MYSTRARGIRFRCTLCGWCCRNHTILVTPQDARRIQSNLQIPLSRFLVFYRLSDFAVPLREDERIFFTKHGPLVMGLRQTDDGCVFLEDGLCSIHSFKPGICRAFPFQPLKTGEVEGAFEFLENACNGNNAEDETVSQESVRNDYKAFIYDYYDYVERVKTWNADPASQERDIEEFLQYVGLEWLTLRKTVRKEVTA